MSEAFVGINTFESFVQYVANLPPDADKIVTVVKLLDAKTKVSVCLSSRARLTDSMSTCSFQSCLMTSSNGSLDWRWDADCKSGMLDSRRK